MSDFRSPRLFTYYTTRCGAALSFFLGAYFAFLWNKLFVSPQKILKSLEILYTRPFFFVPSCLCGYKAFLACLNYRS